MPKSPSCQSTIFSVPHNRHRLFRTPHNPQAAATIARIPRLSRLFLILLDLSWTQHNNLSFNLSCIPQPQRQRQPIFSVNFVSVLVHFCQFPLPKLADKRIQRCQLPINPIQVSPPSPSIPVNSRETASRTFDIAPCKSIIRIGVKEILTILRNYYGGKHRWTPLIYSTWKP